MEAPQGWISQDFALWLDDYRVFLLKLPNMFTPNEEISSASHTYMKKKEVSCCVDLRKLPTDYRPRRRFLVDWIAGVCHKVATRMKSKHLSQRTRHLAILLMDIYVSKTYVSPHDYEFVLVVCLLIAAKFEEQEICVPRYTDLFFALPESEMLTSKDYLIYELDILAICNWQINLLTPPHFIERYMSKCLDPSDVHGNVHIIDLKVLGRNLAKYCEYFLEVCLQDLTYRRYRPSLVACACVFASRFCLGLKPLWVSRLLDLDEFDISDIQHLISPLLSTYRADRRRNADAAQSSMASQSQPSYIGDSTVAVTSSHVPDRCNCGKGDGQCLSACQPLLARIS